MDNSRASDKNGTGVNDLLNKSLFVTVLPVSKRLYGCILEMSAIHRRSRKLQGKLYEHQQPQVVRIGLVYEA